MSRGRPPLPVGTWGDVRVDRVSSGGWRALAYYRAATGRTQRVTRVGRTKGAARATLTEYLVGLGGADETTDLTSSTRLSVLCARWHVARSYNTDRTRRRYDELIRLHINPAGGGLRVGECTTARLERLLHGIADDAGESTARKSRQVLMQAFRYAVRLGAIGHNPVTDTTVIEAKPKEGPRPMEQDEVKALRAAARIWEATERGSGARGRPPKRDIADLVDFLAATGVRIGEALAVRWRDIDLDVGTVLINGTIVREKAEGDTTSHLVRQERRKGGGKAILLDLPRFAIDTLTGRKARMGGSEADPVFPSTSGTWREPGNARRDWRQVADLAGLAWTTPKSARTSVATAVEDSAGMDAAAGQLGHSSTKVTSQFYVPPRARGPAVGAVLQAAFDEQET